jgi:hypothetical protein
MSHKAQRFESTGQSQRRGVMAGGHHQDEERDQLIMRHRRAVRRRIGDQAGEVIARLCAPIGGDGLEIIAQRQHGDAQRVAWSLGHLSQWILGADKSLGEARKPRIVRTRRSQHAADDAEGVGHRDVAREVADAIASRDLIDDFAGPVRKPRLQRTQGRRRKCRLNGGAVDGVIGRVHLGQAAHQLRLAGDPLQHRLEHFAGEVGSRPSGEILAAHLHRNDVGMAGHRAERTHTRPLNPVPRRMLAQQRAGPVHPVGMGVAPGRDQGGGGALDRGALPTRPLLPRRHTHRDPPNAAGCSMPHRQRGGPAA